MWETSLQTRQIQIRFFQSHQGEGVRGAGRLQEVEGRLLARVEEEEVGDEAGADPDLVSEFSRGMYRVTHLLADWVGLTWI